METAALKPSHTDVELAELVYDAFISPLLCFPFFGVLEVQASISC